MKLKPVCALLGLIGACVIAAAASGAGYPERPIRVVVNFPAGGNVDTIARMLGAEMERSLGQNLVIDNRGGANGIIGAETVARATPDGYTVLFTPSSIVVNQVAHAHVPYDVLRDFAPVSNACWGDGYLLVVHPAVPAHSVRELIELAKRPGSHITYGIPGLGNPQQFLGELFNLRAGTHMAAVPYKGTLQQTTALIAGEVQVMFVPPLAGKAHADAGRLRPLAYTGAKRWSGMPQLPTVMEAGLADFEWRSGWQGWFAPAKTPAAIVGKLQLAVKEALAAPRVHSALAAGGYESIGSLPDAFRTFVAAELKRYGDIARAAHIVIQ